MTINSHDMRSNEHAMHMGCSIKPAVLAITGILTIHCYACLRSSCLAATAPNCAHPLTYIRLATCGQPITRGQGGSSPSSQGRKYSLRSSSDSVSSSLMISCALASTARSLSSMSSDKKGSVSGNSGKNSSLRQSTRLYTTSAAARRTVAVSLRVKSSTYSKTLSK
jgi:hypothetical protein